MNNLKNAKLQVIAHNKLKKYCEQNGFTMSHLLSKFAVFIVDNKIHPAYFDEMERDFNLEHWGNIEGKILSELQKFRETYVSFQRTFEKQYQTDITTLKETTFFNSKRVLNLIATNDEKYFKFLSDFIAHLISIEVEGRFQYTQLSESQEQQLLGYNYKEAALKIIRSQTANMAGLSKAVELICQEIEKG